MEFDTEDQVLLENKFTLYLLAVIISVLVTVSIYRCINYSIKLIAVSITIRSVVKITVMGKHSE